jgi:hypothetical protein
MIENRKFQRQDAALWLGLEQILGDDSSVSYNSLEQKNLAYLMNCLNKWLKRWEEELEYKLLTDREYDTDSVYIRFNTAALLKSDYKTSIESLSAAITSTIISPNEAREKLDLNPYDGGDVYANPAITPGSSDTPAPSDGSTPDPGANSSGLAIRARVQHLFGVEANRVKKCAESGNFLARVEAFYSKWEPKLADAFEEVGVDRDEAASHCSESLRRLLDVADYSTADNLLANVSKCVNDWKQRANSIGEIEHV